MPALPQIPAGTQKFAKRVTPQLGAMRSAEDIPDRMPDLMGDSEEPTQEELDAAQIATLVNMVEERIRESVQARQESGIEEEWREADDLFNGYDNLNMPKGRMEIADKTGTAGRDGAVQAGSTLVVNITKPKTKIAGSRVKEMLVPTNERPFDTSPTPVPEFDEVEKDPEQAGQMVMLGDGTQAPALAAVMALKARATKCADAEGSWIEDRFVEGKVYGELRTMIDDAARLGTGVIKGPFAVNRTTRRYEKLEGSSVYELKIASRAKPTSKCISVQDCFPDPACGGNIHNGEFFNEREYMTGRQLRKLQKDPGYSRAAIAHALLEGPKHYAQLHDTGTHSRKLVGNSRREAALYELWHCYGDVSVEAMIAFGVEDVLLGNLGDPEETIENEADSQNVALNDDDEDNEITADMEAALRTVPAVITMLNGRVLKAAVQPLESGEFPYDFFPWEVVKDQPYGKGVPITMRAAQLIVKDGTRRLLENAGMSAGPIVAYINGAMTPANGRWELTGRSLWKFNKTDLIDDIRKAIAVFDIPSRQKELLEVIRFGLEMSDQLTNLPMLLQGDQQAGTSPETLGGMKLLVQNSLSPLRDIAKQHDDYVMIPHLGRYHEWYMANEDVAEKGDSEIKALGSTALVQREEGRMFLQMLAPVKDDPAYRINPVKFAKEFGRSNAYDMSLIQYTDDEWKAEQDKKAQQPPPVDPRIEAAKIRAESDAKLQAAESDLRQAELRAKAAQDAADNELARYVADVNKEIEEMKLSADQNISLDQIKAMLASKAGDIRVKTQEMNLKLSPKNPTHQGI